MTTISTAYAISPLDGRYHRNVRELGPIMSEAGLFQRRVTIEVEYFIKIAPLFGFAIHPFEEKLRLLYAEFSEENVEAIRTWEHKVNHDVKAVEYWLREQADILGIPQECQELIHIALTSEDVNNLAYALQVKDALAILRRWLQTIMHHLDTLAVIYAKTTMMGRTHGQPASPTTLGKELRVFHYRVRDQMERLDNVSLTGKLNGATGTYAAHLMTGVDIEWTTFSGTFVESFGLKFQPVTTQIEPHDRIGDVCQILSAINRILTDLSQDMWLYISHDLLKLKINTNEVGSSTMPHKVNPIDFENAIGNYALSNALLHVLDHELRVSKMQRDLSDSTLLRNIGVAFAYALQGYKSIDKGMQKIEPNTDRMMEELQNHPEILAEAIQTVLRAEGIPNGYELLKNLTRGRNIELSDLHELIISLPISEKARERLLATTPEMYVGYAFELADLEDS